jgi:hypothetical protein
LELETGVPRRALGPSLGALDARSVGGPSAPCSHLIDLPEGKSETAIGTVVSGIVNEFLPRSTLPEMVPNPY